MQLAFIYLLCFIVFEGLNAPDVGFYEGFVPNSYRPTLYFHWNSLLQLEITCWSHSRTLLFWAFRQLVKMLAELIPQWYSVSFKHVSSY